jgi:hypothetical protein
VAQDFLCQIERLGVCLFTPGSGEVVGALQHPQAYGAVVAEAGYVADIAVAGFFEQ